MAATDTLLAYMIPSMTNQVEVAATKALAYILTEYEVALEAFNDLVSTTIDQQVLPVKRVAVEVTYGSGKNKTGRLDLVGYDEPGKQRVIVEAKFGANLSKGQGSGYFGQLNGEGTSVLMLLVPSYRIEYLWSAVTQDLLAGIKGATLDEAEPKGQIKYSRVNSVDSTDRYLMIVSWRQLLEEIKQKTGDNFDCQSDVHQLIGVTERMDTQTFPPITDQELELGPEFARRNRDFVNLIEGATDQARLIGWLSTDGLRPASRDYGYGRYVALSGVINFWLGVNYDLWATTGESPMWLCAPSSDNSILDEIERNLKVNEVGSWSWIPIYLEPGKEFDEVRDSVVSQLKAVADAIKDTNPPAQSD